MRTFTLQRAPGSVIIIAGKNVIHDVDALFSADHFDGEPRQPVTFSFRMGRNHLVEFKFTLEEIAGLIQYLKCICKQKARLPNASSDQ